MGLTYNFDCGCKIPVLDKDLKENDGIPSMEIPYEEMARQINYTQGCPGTWGLMSEGRTKGVFQLETQLGQGWAGKLKPTSLEEIAALVSLIRPGCVIFNSKIKVALYDRGNGKIGYKSITIEELHKRFHRKHPSYINKIVSLNEETNEFFENKILDVIYSGEKDTYKLLLKTRHRTSADGGKFFNLECTLDHPILTHDRGWIQLKDLNLGERIAVFNNSPSKSKHVSNIEGEKNFRNICFRNYKYHCVFCDWNEASLDCNHLEGNRKTDNSSENLCFLCPNHHKMYSEGLISKEECVKAREKYRIANSNDIMWAQYTGKEFAGKNKVYDISVEGPNHNFIAGNVVVHNCLRAMVDVGEGKTKSMTQLYVDRKSGEEEIKYFHDALEPILRPTYGVLTFQEQAMRIAVDIAGFTEQQADVLRKAIGKKLPEVMAKVKGEFIDGCAKEEVVNGHEAEQIFAWIQESQRYSFNRSHGVGYGVLGYLSMFAKFHFPLHFYCSWLKFARNKQDTLQEMKELVADAKMSDTLILPPSIDNIFLNHADVCVNDDHVNFGIKCIKKIGDASVKKFLARIRLIEGQLGTTIDQWTWLAFLTNVGAKVNKTTVNNLISVGTFTKYGISRTQMLYDYEAYSKLTIKESDNVCKLVNTGRFENLTSVLQYFVTLEKKGGGPSTAPRREKIDSIIDYLKKPPFSMQDKPAWILKQEKALIGTPISYSAIDTVNVKINTNTTCREFKEGKSGSDLTVAVELTSVREWTVKSGKNKGSVMAFATAEDNTGSIDCVIFSDGFHLFEHLLTDGNMVVLSGERSNKGSFQINKIFQI